MTAKSRSHLEIQMKILEAITVERWEPHIYSQILFKVEMSTKQLTRYLQEMITKGLITIELIPHYKVVKNQYKITENGKIILRMWIEFNNLWETLTKSKLILRSDHYT